MHQSAVSCVLWFSMFCVGESVRLVRFHRFSMIDHCFCFISFCLPFVGVVGVGAVGGVVGVGGVTVGGVVGVGGAGVRFLFRVGGPSRVAVGLLGGG